jgi:hypothetical protein
MWEMKMHTKFWLQKPERKLSLARVSCIWKDNIKNDLEIRYEYMNSVEVRIEYTGKLL